MRRLAPLLLALLAVACSSYRDRADEARETYPVAVIRADGAWIWFPEEYGALPDPPALWRNLQGARVLVRTITQIGGTPHEEFAETRMLPLDLPAPWLEQDLGGRILWQFPNRRTIPLQVRYEHRDAPPEG